MIVTCDTFDNHNDAYVVFFVFAYISDEKKKLSQGNVFEIMTLLHM